MKSLIINFCISAVLILPVNYYLIKQQKDVKTSENTVKSVKKQDNVKFIYYENGCFDMKINNYLTIRCA